DPVSITRLVSDGVPASTRGDEQYREEGPEVGMKKSMHGDGEVPNDALFSGKNLKNFEMITRRGGAENWPPPKWNLGGKFMARGKTTPSYFLLAPDPARQAEWMHRLRRHGAVRAFDSIEAAKAEVESSRRPWLSFIVDIDGDGRSIHRLLKSMRRASPDAPGLLVMETPPRSPEAIEEVGFRFLTRDAPVAEIRYFLGYGLALEVTRDPHIAAAVEQMGRQMALTVKQMELTALAATPLARDTLVEGLGVSHNTVKTRIRQLLR